MRIHQTNSPPRKRHIHAPYVTALAVTVFVTPLITAQDDADSRDGDIVEDMEIVLDDVTESLKEGDTDVEAGRSFLAKALDFLAGIVLAAYDAIAAALSSYDGSLPYDTFEQFVVGMDYYDIASVLEIYGVELHAIQTNDDGTLTYTWMDDDGNTVDITIRDDVLVEKHSDDGDSGA